LYREWNIVDERLISSGEIYILSVDFLDESDEDLRLQRDLSMVVCRPEAKSQRIW